ncbi:MAG: molecular chaperone DnaJ [Actinomycetia bacterium]|nr:molecular chaperone DnaJ [Actinomycetes bacterium]
MAQTDYYALLGVSKDSSSDEIKRAFRKKARKCHPDVSDAPDAEETFKKLNEAYDVLSDPRKRAQYDQFGSVGGTGYGSTGSAGGYPYAVFGDLFGSGGVSIADLFSAFMGGARRGGRSTMRAEGRDLTMQVGVTLEEAAQGLTREITVDRLSTCEDCSGSGSVQGSHPTRCPECGGSGQKTTYQRTLLGTMQTSSPCMTCQGMGTTIANPCTECEGSGRVVDRQQIPIDIPAGIFDGQQIRVPHRGEAGIRGAASGDLIVSVRVLPHERFERQNSDLHMLMPLSFTQAALGATKTISGLLEEVTLEIPAGIQSGERVKVSGKGMPVMNRDMYGDLYCHIEVVVPRKLTARQRELMDDLSKEFGDSQTSVVTHHRTGFDKVKDWFNR